MSLLAMNRVFSLLCNEKITLKPMNERSQENEMLQRTHKIYNISKSQVCAAHPFLVVYQNVSRQEINKDIRFSLWQ